MYTIESASKPRNSWDFTNSKGQSRVEFHIRAQQLIGKEKGHFLALWRSNTEYRQVHDHLGSPRRDVLLGIPGTVKDGTAKCLSAHKYRENRLARNGRFLLSITIKCSNLIGWPRHEVVLLGTVCGLIYTQFGLLWTRDGKGNKFLDVLYGKKRDDFKTGGRVCIVETNSLCAECTQATDQTPSLSRIPSGIRMNGVRTEEMAKNGMILSPSLFKELLSRLREWFWSQSAHKIWKTALWR